jgi:hypothetical protein
MTQVEVETQLVSYEHDIPGSQGPCLRHHSAMGESQVASWCEHN